MIHQQENELLPCPCCGAHLPQFRRGEGKKHSIKCTECPVRAEYFSSTWEQAVFAWNRRATPLAPTPAAAEGRADAINEKRLRELISVLKNAEFDCGEWDGDASDQAPYRAILQRANDATDAIVEYVLAALLPRQAAVGLSDTDRMDLVAKSGVRGGTYKGITSINVIVHEDDLLCGGARYAIDCMIERDSAAPTVKASQ